MKRIFFIIFLFVLFFIVAGCSVVEIAFAYKIYTDLTGGMANVEIGLQIITLLVLLPSIFGTVSGVRESSLPLIISNLVNLILYFISGILVIFGTVETSNKLLAVMMLSCKMVLFVILTIFMYGFGRNFEKNDSVKEIDVKNDYAFRRFGNFNFVLVETWFLRDGSFYDTYFLGKFNFQYFFTEVVIT